MHITFSGKPSRQPASRLRQALASCLALAWAASTAAVPAASPDPGATVTVFGEFKARTPKTCTGVVTGMSGLCLLASRSPEVRNRFTISPLNSSGRPTGNARTVPFNQFLRLSPGQYALYSESGLDQFHERVVAIQSGAVATIATATVRFHPSAKAFYRLQHHQSGGSIDGQGCAAEVLKRGPRALLPGAYQVNQVDQPGPAAPLCPNTGTTVFLSPGQTLTARTTRARPQAVATAHSFRHPNGLSSLASVGYAREDIHTLSLLPRWRSFRGIHNPHQKASDALVLSSIGGREFLVPFEWRRGKRQCGLSLALAGMPAHVLMTDCVFKGSRLTSFRVNPGAYPMYNNRHGKPSIEGNSINNPVLVSGVRFNSTGG